jgi:hypothetical protein
MPGGYLQPSQSTALHHRPLGKKLKQVAPPALAVKFLFQCVV